MEFLLSAYDVFDKDSASQSAPKSCMTNYLGSFLSPTPTHIHIHILFTNIYKILKIACFESNFLSNESHRAKLKTKWRSAQNFILPLFLSFFILLYGKLDHISTDNPNITNIYSLFSVTHQSIDINVIDKMILNELCFWNVF